MTYNKDVAKEVDLKNVILHRPSLFGNTGEATIIFEKMIHKYSVITDCLIFTEKKGIIAIEIKTENDSLKRLNKQLQAYKAIADFPWVLCHDKHVKKVEEILDKNHHNGVGIMSYSEFEGTILTGVIRDSNTSTAKSSRVVLDMLWKPELIWLANYVKNGYSYSQLNLPSYYHVAGDSLQSVISKRMHKEGIIDYLIGHLGAIESAQLVCDMFRAGVNHPEKVLKRYHFKEVDKNER